MPYIQHFPLKEKPVDITTSQDIVQQAWAELTILRHVRRPKTISPLIDQARAYFEDARPADWRTAGLLYYYSFLNLAKAVLVARRVISFKKLVQVQAYHGLAAPPQSQISLPDYRVEIHPPIVGGKVNVFSSLYRCVTGKLWPFSEKIEIPLRDVLGHCVDIADELHQLHDIYPLIVRTQSLARSVGKKAWFEMTAYQVYFEMIRDTVPDYQLEYVQVGSMTRADKQDWLVAFHIPAGALQRGGLVRGPIRETTEQNTGKILGETMREATECLSPFAVPTVYNDPINQYWLFVPPVKLAGQDMVWHPALSDYLVAFVLSTILRYQPYNLESSSKDFVVAQGWCSQSSSVALRYFLMLLTKPPKRLRTYR